MTAHPSRTATGLARESGYTGNSPALLGAFEAIRLHGIREARKGHYDRKRLIDQMKAEPGMFFVSIRPQLSTDEAIEDAKRVIFGWKNLPRWRQELRTGELLRAKQQHVISRYFRRFGKAIWMRNAA